LVVQVLGSWCPNCLDETRFLVEKYTTRPENVEFVGLAFERKSDFAYAKSRIEVVKNKLQVPYPMLIAGISNKDSAAKVLASISRVAAFPTTIFVRADGRVLKVHTGFSGPATGAFYEAWKKEFDLLVAEINKP
jgi:thiol-disulfide isomerase/thioredoxin